MDPDDSPRLRLDPAQAAVLALPIDASAVVVGAPGSGKTATLVELLAERAGRNGWSTDSVLALAPGRAQAAGLRDRLAARLGSTSGGARARTPQSLAFGIVRAARAAAGQSAPALLTGADQDALIRELLEAHVVAGPSTCGWPTEFTGEVLALGAFRAEVRDVLAVMSEYDVTPDELAGLSKQHPAWLGVARLARDLEAVRVFQRDGVFDVPGLLLEAASLVHAGEAASSLAGLRLVAVDDAQELTEAGRRLLVALESAGVAIVSFGDPDVATGVFRGGAAEHATGWRSGDADPPIRLLLGGVHRHGAPLRDVVVGLTHHLGARGEARQRAAGAVADHRPPASPPEVAGLAGARRLVSADLVDEAGGIAAYLRRLHLEHGVAWRDLAVVSRSGADAPSLARLLRRHDVPTVLQQVPAARDDQTVIAVTRLAAMAAGDEPVTGALIGSLLASPLFAVDGVRLRQLRRALRLQELAGGGVRTADELLVELVAAPAATAGLEQQGPDDGSPSRLGLPATHSAVRAVRRLAAILRAARETARDGAADEVLWAVWEGAGVAETWRRTALAGGLDGAAADERLDAVVALFDAAKRVVERTPDASVSHFLSTWDARGLANDSLARRADRDAVALLTPAGAVGHEYRGVVVRGLVDGLWPNLRVRDSLLGAGRLVELLTGRDLGRDLVDRRREVRDDETRMFVLAASRAREFLLLSAIDGDDALPSILFRRVDAPMLDPAVVELPTTLRALVASLRARVRQGIGDEPRTTEAERLALAKLAVAGVDGADPESWSGVRAMSSTRPLVDPRRTATIEGDAPELSVAPSGIERFEACGVDWFVTTHGGDRGGASASRGTIVHESAEYEFASLAERRAHAAAQFTELGGEPPWRAEAMRRQLDHLIEVLHDHLRVRRAEGAVAVGIERRFRIELPVETAGLRCVVVVRGKIDRLERIDDGVVTVVDFKTGKAKTKDAALIDPQLGIYQLAVTHGEVAGDEAPMEELPAGAVRLDPGTSIETGTRVDSAELRYVGDTNEPKVLAQPAADDAARTALEARLVHAAVGMAGLLLGDDGVVPPSSSGAAYLAQPDEHCRAAGSGIIHACRIHIVPEVTE